MDKSGNYLRESVTQSLDTYVILIGRLTSHKLRQERQEQWKVIQVQALMCNTGVRVAVEEVTPSQVRGGGRLWAGVGTKHQGGRVDPTQSSYDSSDSDMEMTSSTDRSDASY